MAKRIAQTHRVFGHTLSLRDHNEGDFGGANTVWLGRWIDRAMPDEPAHWCAVLRRQQRKVGNRTAITWHLSLTGSNAAHEIGDVGLEMEPSIRFKIDCEYSNPIVQAASCAIPNARGNVGEEFWASLTGGLVASLQSGVFLDLATFYPPFPEQCP